MSMKQMSPTNRPVVQYPASPTRQVIAVPSVSSPVPLSAGSFVSPVSMVPPVTTPMPMTYSQVSQVAPVLTSPFQFGKVSNPSLTVKKPLEAGAAEAAKCGQSIHHAAKMGNIEAIRYIHRNHPHSIHTYDETGQMPLHHAVCKGHKEMVKELLKHGADIEATNHDGDTPLYHAVSEGNAEVVRLLLDNGADLHAREKFVGGTPLHHAALHGRTNVVNVLLERSPDLEALNRKRQTPLHVASLYGHLDTAKILLEKGANAEAKDIRGCTPANLANKTGHEDMENLLC